MVPPIFMSVIDTHYRYSVWCASYYIVRIYIAYILGAVRVRVCCCVLVCCLLLFVFCFAVAHIDMSSSVVIIQ